MKAHFNNRTCVEAMIDSSFISVSSKLTVSFSIFILLQLLPPPTGERLQSDPFVFVHEFGVVLGYDFVQ